MTTDLESLMHANLLDVFGQRDPELRSAAIRKTYTEDVVFLDPDGIVEGRDALNAKAQQILDSAPGFVFSPAGPIYTNHDMGYLAWNFGPEGQAPVASGFDTGFLREGLLAKVYTVLTA